MEWNVELLRKLNQTLKNKWEEFGFKNKKYPVKMESAMALRSKEWDKFCSKHKITQIDSFCDEDAWMHWLNIGTKDHVIMINPNKNASDFIAVPMDFAEKCLALGL